MVLALVYMAVIFWASSLPGDDVSGWLVAPDEVLHGITYAGLAVVWHAALRRRWAVDRRAAVGAAFVITVLYGLSDEYHQSFVPGRTASFGDLLADALGAGIGLALVHLARGRRMAKV